MSHQWQLSPNGEKLGAEPLKLRLLGQDVFTVNPRKIWSISASGRR